MGAVKSGKATPPAASELRPGDVLLYGGSGLWYRLIQVKTYSDVGHVEVYAGGGKVVTATPNGGVDYHHYEPKNLRYVRRPVGAWSLALADEWFRTVRGAKYDKWGLIWNFTRPEGDGERSAAMVCSEVSTLYLRAGGVDPFSQDTKASKVSPAEFKRTNDLSTFWNHEQGWL